MQFNRINNIVGWAVCLLACTVYILTAEAGGSFWDCGEFVSSCFKLQIPHPPGAPLFVILGRLFIVIFGNSPDGAAKAVNIMSALASGFTILFLFWTITHFARRIVQVKTSDILTSSQAWAIMGAGVVGALAYTFSDSFWYSAVEGEVYAMSSFFTAIVFWAILKWENHADEPGADRWIVFIFFLMGLSIGVHLLNLLTIPAIVMVYYFRRRASFNYEVIRKWFLRITVVGGIVAFIGALVLASRDVNEERGMSFDGTLAGMVIMGVIGAIALLFLTEKFKKDKKAYYGGMYIFFVIGCAITGIVQVGVIQYTVKVAGAFDRWFVNDFGLPFFSGFTFFFILVAALIWYGFRFAAKKGWAYLRLSLWCLAFMLVGYSTYVTTMIRSNANPSVDMYNVDNPMSLVGYLGRDQYGDFPLLYGQKYTAEPRVLNNAGMRYQKGGNKYVPIGEDKKYGYAPEDKMIFPRVWDASDDQNHAYFYSVYLGINKMKDGSYERAPNQIDNIKFFAGYQVNWMYFRYFMWNFAGKQNDNQGIFDGNVRDGNWITGIGPIDSMLYGDQSAMPDSLKNNKAHNKLFALPFILGLIGLFYQFKKRGDDAVANFLMFFFTGFAIVLYLNQAGFQPRERDYAYVGSFYAFAVWIGLGVLKVRDWLSKGLSQATAASLATVICLLAVPVLMAQQEWDDHDRSKKVLAPDLARDYLESCAPNAILFTYGDNDTYPLWYAQEVEGVRPDIRVINYSLLGIDWYINQLRYKVNQSDPIDVIWSADQIEGEKRNYILYRPKPGIPEDRYYDMYDLMKNYAGSDDPAKMEDRGGGEMVNTYPVRKMSVPVDRATVLQNGTVNANDSIVPELRFEIPKAALMKNDLAVLNVIAANKWKRPIYFTNPSAELGFDQYIRRDGMSFRLVPVQGSRVNTDWMLDKVTNKFRFGNANVKGVYFDEENRRHLNSIRSAYTELAMDLSSKNRKDDAKKVLNQVDKMMDPSNFPYGLTSRANLHNRNSLLFLEACYMAGDTALANKVSASVKTDLEQQIKYYNSLSGKKADNMADEKRTAESYLQGLQQMKTMYNPAIQIPGKMMAAEDSTPKK
ncbi:protein O-mannosyl-transferase family [Sediminibacterium ginsengisoli]|uniref:DUF2723 domain-containing protein n=1 Tax=Sediminibacterium ginsengisoli TaxID=413434 RepID=A0A1T4QUT7_9BACT|nr:DUF2723 domain-containing protein [Sediminibacterium ginsengisoli]SKA07513.1 Protein of unknown function [Sediminibacterium ginsengisoli]